MKGAFEERLSFERKVKKGIQLAYMSHEHILKEPKILEWDRKFDFIISRPRLKLNFDTLANVFLQSL